MNRGDRIYVAGHQGMVGSAILRGLEARGYTDIVTRSSRELDLRRQQDVESFFDSVRPHYVFLAAARVGGILANSAYPADFIYDNTAIGLNVIQTSRRAGVKKLLNLGSSCIFPRLAHQPLKEEYLLTGPLEPTNEAYAIAKIAAIKLCRYYNEQHGTDFLSVMPTNLYGPNDNFDLETSHVLPALLRKTHEAKEEGKPLTVWGDGTPRRELLYVDDLADAAIHLMERCSYIDVGEFVNVGTGRDITIRELAELIACVVGYDGELEWDTSKPTGTPRKLLDIARISSLGWEPKTPLRDGIARTYAWFIESGTGK